VSAVAGEPSTAGTDAASGGGVAEAKKPGWREKKAKKAKPFEGITGKVIVLHEDIIGDRFWTLHPWLLS
jgi:hypothetical protein